MLKDDALLARLEQGCESAELSEKHLAILRYAEALTCLPAGG